MSSRYLVTGAAGFIGSHIVERLLRDGHTVVGFDDFSTGKEKNLAEVQSLVGADAWTRFTLCSSSIADAEAVLQAADGTHVIIHQAALGSVPLSIEQPRRTHEINATGFLNILEAARAHGIPRVVYASSSAVYGNCPDMPLREPSAGAVLSPYAASKFIDEILARAFSASYGLETIGLRYFNVFGPRQDPAGAYAAVIPRWIQQTLAGEPLTINGAGDQTRDFCYVQDIVAANLAAATLPPEPGRALAANVGRGESTSLVDLARIISSLATSAGLPPAPVHHGPNRPGDIRHSTADTSSAEKTLGFRASHPLQPSLQQTFDWFARLKSQGTLARLHCCH